MLSLFDQVIGRRRVRIVASERSDGDLHPHRVPEALLDERQRSLVGSRVVMTEQVHGVDVHRVESLALWPLAVEADVLVTQASPAGIWAGDCAPIFLVGALGTIVGAHGGWRGLAAGVIDVAVDELRASGEPVTTALVGPLIHPCCYEFGAGDAAEVAAGVHAAPGAVSGTTREGRTALDIRAAVRAGLAAHDIELEFVGPCTGCTDRWFSHRARQDRGRHAVIAWTEVWE